MGETPRLSPSIAHRLTTECPLSAWSAHRLLGNHREKKKESQVEGQLWHAALLESGSGIEVIDCDAFRSKIAKEARDKALHDGKIPITAPKWEAMQDAVLAIQAQLRAHGVELGEGVVEERIEWDQRTTAGEMVACSGYIDHRKDLQIDDLTTGSACTSKRMASMLVAKSHALLQDAAYRSAIAALHDVDLERIQMRFVFVQTQEPYAVTPLSMSGEFRELSLLRWQRAIDDWAKYLALGTDRKHWPGPVEEGETGTIHPPGWMMAQELEEEAMRS